MKALYWFRNDLRLHDNQILHELSQYEGEISFIYTLTHNYYQLGEFRKSYLWQTLNHLKENLQSFGHTLFITDASPEVFISELVIKYGYTDLYYTGEYATYEIQDESKIAQSLNSLCKIHRFDQQTLIREKDLPFEISNLPMIFTKFKNEVEAKFIPDMPLNEIFPLHLQPFPIISTNELITPKDLPPTILSGGEAAGKRRVEEYIWEKDRLRVYKETRNSLLNPDDSSRFSSWLATGAISPRYILSEVHRYERERIKNDSTYWIFYELLWRDYFKFLAKKYPKKIFSAQGLRHKNLPQLSLSQDSQIFEKWRDSKTGVPLIDAAMKELKATGFLSNRARQNVASYLTRHLGVDWRLGANYFEQELIDYDCAVNWGNWAYVSGAGVDPRDRTFNPDSQTKAYDPNHEYINYWLS